MGFKIPIDPVQKAQEIRKYWQMVPFCEMIAKKKPKPKTKKKKKRTKNKTNKTEENSSKNSE